MAKATISLFPKLPNIYVAIGAASWASYLINGDAALGHGRLTTCLPNR
jgi:hypothetical protein